MEHNLELLKKQKEWTTKAINKERGQNAACQACEWGYCIGSSCNKINNTFAGLFKEREAVNESITNLMG